MAYCERCEYFYANKPIVPHHCYTDEQLAIVQESRRLRDIQKKKLKVRFFFAWYDMWVGAFWDREKRKLYVCPLPCCVFTFKRGL